MPGAGAQVKNLKMPEPELSLKFKIGAGAMAILEVAPQARRQDLAAGGAKNQKEGPETRREAKFLKYSIGCMQQPGGQT